MEFIECNLPPPPARVLDAGCGSGELAEALRRRGFDVTAIDIDPSLGGAGTRVADICSYEDDPFDAVIFQVSLHHMRDLHGAVERASALIKPGGQLIVDEFAHERADAAIADRFYGEPGSLARWRERHCEYHTGAAMVEAISARMVMRSVRRVPYLYRYLADDSLRETESVLGLQIVADPDPMQPSRDNLGLVGQLHGRDHARAVRRHLQYDPAPPYLADEPLAPPAQS